VSEETRVAKRALGGGAVVTLARPNTQDAKPAIAEEQVAYARWLDRGVKAGLLLLVVSSVPYVLGMSPAHVPVADLPRYWSMPVKEYLAATGTHAGWGWLTTAANGDLLSFVGIAVLSGVTIACYAAVTPMFFRRKDRVYGWLALLEVLVLGLAASGMLSYGGR
jgi:hypothetical protein